MTRNNYKKHHLLPTRPKSNIEIKQRRISFIQIRVAQLLQHKLTQWHN